MSELTAENFVSLIKQMNDRDQNKLRAAVLIGLIIQLPESPSTLITELTAKVDGLIATMHACMYVCILHHSIKNIMNIM